MKPADDKKILSEAQRLYRQGFGIHWLKPLSKMPAASKWTTGPRMEWKDLKESFESGMNVGVRLGHASKLPNGMYLGVIDCDVKSKDPAHKAEMMRALTKIFPNVKQAPVVYSGRGNGSCHIYVTTEAPGKPQRLTQSGTTVEVHMPSVRPSKKDLEALGEKAEKQGLRLRPAWEISFMGEGQQVVIPPSIHPDSGRAYVWGQEYALPPTFDLSTVAPMVKPDRVETEVPFKFEPIDIDLDMLDLAPSDLELIRTGDGVDDRSTGLFIAARALIKLGLEDDEILSVLTDRDTYLGQAAFDHAQTTNRARAAYWLERYTLRNARKEFSAQSDFEQEVQTTILNDVEAAAQKEDLEELTPWQSQLERNQHGAPKTSASNIILVLRNCFPKLLFRYNLFTGQEIFGASHAELGFAKGKPLTDANVIALKFYIAQHFRFEPEVNRINEAITHVAQENKFHPVTDYLDTLEWDGKPRVEKFLERYFGAEGNPVYLRAASKKVLCAMVARVYEPGIKFDNILIIEGKQGLGKSTAIRALASDEWFSDTVINVADKDSVMNLQGNWIMELGEIASMRKADLDLLKAYITRTTDKIRVPYGRRTEQFPRQCIFIGTKNPDGEYLKDPTGARRYWPVHVTKSDVTAIKRNRDQILAEAKALWEMGEQLYLDDEEAAAGALEAQEDRTTEDPLVEKVAEWFEDKRRQPEAERGFPLDGFSMNQVLGDFGPLSELSNTHSDALRAGRILRALGFEKVVTRLNRKLQRLWFSKDFREKGKDEKRKARKVWITKGVAGSA